MGGWECLVVRGVAGIDLSTGAPARHLKRIRCFNCGDVSRHLASACPHPPLPKRCHHCKSPAHLIEECPALSPSKRRVKPQQEAQPQPQTVDLKQQLPSEPLKPIQSQGETSTGPKSEERSSDTTLKEVVLGTESVKPSAKEKVETNVREKT